MGLKESIIKKLENDVEPNAGHIELENLSEEERNKMFIKFGEGNVDLTNFLKTAFNHNAPSIFCCSGHGFQSAYVSLKVNDENIELLRKTGKVLSKYGVSTNFTDDHIRGLYVHFCALHNNPSTKWLNIASQIMENPEIFDDSNSEICYHEEIHKSYKPLLFDLKKKLLHYLREDSRKKLLSRKFKQRK